MATQQVLEPERLIDEELGATLCQLLEARYERGMILSAIGRMQNAGLDPKNILVDLFNGTRGFSRKDYTNAVIGILMFNNEHYTDFFRWCIEQTITPLHPEQCATLERWFLPSLHTVTE